MNTIHAIWRNAAAILMILGLSVGCARADSIELPYVKTRLVQVDVYDRAEGLALPVYAKNGRHYIVGTPGHEYAVRIRNCTGGRVLIVTSVDGVNVISGDTAAPSQSGYVLDPWGSVEIAGWRKNMERTAAFYFTDLGNSYAARTGRPQNVGVIGVAVFQEQPQSAQEYDSAGSASRREAAAPSVKDSNQTERKMLGKLGTGHGRSEDSFATAVTFERSTDSPVETVAIQYDRRENLAAMQVLPRPYYARAASPDPFPAAPHFVPDPE